MFADALLFHGPNTPEGGVGPGEGRHDTDRIGHGGGADRILIEPGHHAFRRVDDHLDFPILDHV